MLSHKYGTKVSSCMCTLYIKMPESRGTWVAQMVEWPAPDFGSGRDLTVVRSSLVMGSVLSIELLGILSLSPSLYLSLSLSK